MIVGLDFGTTNTVLSYEEEGMIKYITYNDIDDTYENLPNYLLPSAVYVSKDDATKIEHISVGKTAFARRFSKHGTYVDSVKRRLEKDSVEMIMCPVRQCDGIERVEEYSVCFISTMILKKAFKRLCQLFPDETVFNIMFTVPVKYSLNYKILIKSLIEKVNGEINQDRELDNLPIVYLEQKDNNWLEEPVAAVIACKELFKDDNAVFVIDFGGGTLDVSVVNKNQNIYRVCSEGGLEDCGGDDFDEKLAELISEKCREKGVFVHINEEKVAEDIRSERVRKESRYIKERFQLSDQVEYIEMELNRIGVEKNESIDILYKEYLECTRELRERVIKVIREVYNKYKAENNESIEKVLLIGGMSNERFIRDFLINDIHFSKEKIYDLREDEYRQGIVSKGATILNVAIENHDKNEIFVTNAIYSTIAVLLEDGSYEPIFTPYTPISEMTNSLVFSTKKSCHQLNIQIIEFFGEYDKENPKYTTLSIIRVPIYNCNEETVVYADFSLTNDNRIEVIAYPKGYPDKKYNCEILFQWEKV